MTTGTESRRGKRIARGLAIFAIAVGLAGVSGRTVVRSSLPDYARSARLTGLGEDVTVTRDEHAVPSIWAANEPDAYRALGYLHAQDRLWQMELLRHIADGRLAEMFGGDLVETDLLMRTLGLGRAAAADAELLDDEARRDLEAYVAGVNAFIGEHPGALPPELLVLRVEPEPWTVRNSLSIAKIIAADLAAFGMELEHQRAVDLVGPERAAELVPDYPKYGPVILPELGGPATAPPPRDVHGMREPIENAGHGLAFAFSDITESMLASVTASHASNSWVIGGSRTASGKPILANDAHLTLRAPSLWYLAALHGGAVARAGVTIPGIPGVVLGKAPTFAWGFTDAMVDDVDFFVERTAGDDAYLTERGPRPFEKRQEIVKVRGKSDVVHVVRTTRHGPVLSDVDKRIKDRVLAMRWTAIEPARGMNALLRMNRAATWKDLVTATRDFDTAKQNMVFAADDGTIGYVLLGKVPVRKKGDGLLPVPGWTGEYEWERYLTPEEKPTVVNPKEGFIVTANNRQVSDAYPFLLTKIWASPFRAMRIREMVSGASKVTAADVARQQMDLADTMAARFLPLAKKAADAAGDAEARTALDAWNTEARPDSRGAALFWLWLEALRRRVGEDEWKGEKMYFPRFALIDVLDRGGGAWVDDVRTPEVETLADVAREAMKDATRLAAGGKVWRDFHATYIDHPLGRVAALDALFGFAIGPDARGGSPYAVNVAGYADWNPPFKCKEAASHREIVDLADDLAGGFVIPTGESGHPSSPHYRDLHELWLRGDVVPMPLDRAKSDARARTTTTLKR